MRNEELGMRRFKMRSGKARMATGNVSCNGVGFGEIQLLPIPHSSFLIPHSSLPFRFSLFFPHSSLPSHFSL